MIDASVLEKTLPKNNLKINNNITILNEQKIGFIRVSRVASTNIHFSLLKSANKDINLSKSDKQFRTISSKFEKIKGKNWLTFSLIRDPLERFKSAWWFYYSNQSSKQTNNICGILDIKKIPNIDSFVDIIIESNINNLPRHIRPQWTSYIYNNKIFAEYIFKLENLHIELNNIKQLLHKQGLEFKYINHYKTSKKPQNINLSNKSIEKLKKKFEVDYQLHSI